MFSTKKSESNTAPASNLDENTRPVISNEQKTQSKTVISKECHIKGNISGNDDISIFGTVEGTIKLNNAVTIEKSAKVTADIFANVVNINGNVEGNITANEKIIITDGGNVTGDMSAPKIILKDGSYFKGNVSMQDTKVRTTPVNAIKSTPAPTNTIKNTTPPTSAIKDAKTPMNKLV